MGRDLYLTAGLSSLSRWYEVDTNAPSHEQSQSGLRPLVASIAAGSGHTQESGTDRE